jgi:hypothetical protein
MLSGLHDQGSWLLQQRVQHHSLSKLSRFVSLWIRHRYKCWIDSDLIHYMWVCHCRHAHDFRTDLITIAMTCFMIAITYESGHPASALEYDIAEKVMLRYYCSWVLYWVLGNVHWRNEYYNKIKVNSATEYYVEFDSWTDVVPDSGIPCISFWLNTITNIYVISTGEQES